MKRNPDMDESAVWAGICCMADFLISRLHFISPLSKCGPKAQLAWNSWVKNLASLTMQVYQVSNFYFFL